MRTVTRLQSAAFDRKRHGNSHSPFSFRLHLISDARFRHFYWPFPAYIPKPDPPSPPSFPEDSGQSRVTPLGSEWSLSGPMRLAWPIMELESGAEWPERIAAGDATACVPDPDGPPRRQDGARESNNGGGERRQETDESTRRLSESGALLPCWQLFRIDETDADGSPNGITINVLGLSPMPTEVSKHLL